MAADLHNHTTASDGTLSPAELVRRAKAAGLHFVGVTDHDTTAGLAEAAEAAGIEGIGVVPGVELSTDATGREVHILGYFCRTADSPLADLMEEMRTARRRRVEQIIGRLCEAGIPVSADRVLALAGGGVAGRPHVARALVEQGLAEDINDAFQRFLVRGRPGYVPRRKLHPVEAVRLVRQAGGVAALAHPGLMGGDEVIGELLAAGLQAIEVYYPEHTPYQVKRYADLARAHGLIVTGGSDFHGDGERPANVGSVTVDDGTVEQLAEAARRNGGAV